MGSPIAQIAGEDDFEAIKSTVGLSNGEQVKHGLRGVVASAISTVKDGDPCSVLCARSTLPVATYRCRCSRPPSGWYQTAFRL